ncbi:MAG: response regulator transcription factor [Candidatus Omnitrophica bacterium]|nr:response regulator transcription factor [Candidatus Omnitrophota bacterium]
MLKHRITREHMIDSSEYNSVNPINWKARVVIVDDEPTLRFGLTQILGNEKNLDVCGEASNFDQALRLIERVRPDMAVLDISLEKRCGIEIIRTIRQRFGSVKLLVWSLHDEALYAERVLHAGAMGYISKREEPAKIVQAIFQILNGKKYLSERMVSLMLKKNYSDNRLPVRSPVEVLTDRELEILEMIGMGFSTVTIAHCVQRSVKTIEAHRANIKKKLNLTKNSELIRYAVEWIHDSQSLRN